MIETTNKRVVEIINETVDSQTVKIRTLYEPIFVRLWEIAKEKLEAYHTDIIHDALGLGFAEVGDKFLWGYRNTGSNLIKITNRYNAEQTLSLIAAMTNPLDSWHLIEITRNRPSGHADGYVTWINAQDADHLKRVILDNLTSE